MTLTFLNHFSSKVQTLVIHYSSEEKISGELINDIIIIPTFSGKSYDNQISLKDQINDKIEFSCAASFYLQNRFSVLEKLTFNNPDASKK